MILSADAPERPSPPQPAAASCSVPRRQLRSTDAAFTTGTALVVDGGHIARR
ncbi:hypothetical protein [Streptomyces odontomachi]|uniref:hypothetical protein n=1 Tax=Streptomyces odontomachi TaxID=2944940 RepID=UPI00210B0A8B|nr:hypothetical protein [Streptomyces sp. ODS25]